ncbi:hypothetical protein E1264_33315 [Actinomadura sp. KC216]|uniref:hypothetical protein n=1 Tax=Actinomadura sp. KC216 TaxID=2530370 RepID=UPI001050FB82|nr:hypothetical protein [Actinomadura sp. KC216]TDB80985.1 hypothetical protein E1264_33315 [Actinomadura sp. KC216]
MQEYVEKMEIERGLAGLSLGSQCLKLAEEIGELAAASGEDDEVPGECVDVLILLASILNRAGIDLERTVADRFPGTGRVTLADLPARMAGSDLVGLDVAGLCVRAAIETGELCRAVRKLNGAPSDPGGRTVVLAETCADLVLLLGAFAHLLSFDLAEAFRAKEEINNSRVWT